ncbi:MAG: DEAD/DEAH box helicase [Promethearchaeota archaeon]
MPKIKVKDKPIKKDFTLIINELKRQSFYENQIVHIEKIEKRKPKYQQLSYKLHPKIEDWLKFQNIQFYSHQAQAIDAVLNKKNVILVTSTASGKTLAYNIPVFQSLLNERETTFLYIFPLKALAQDQYSKILEMADFLEIPPNLFGVYDGDTSTEEKRRIRREARVILTNPHALHYYLPHHDKWSRIFKNLKYIIVDECHHYRGVFGSNCAFLFRRLKRIVKWLKYKKEMPQFILTSATIANPKEHAEKLTNEKDFCLIDEDGSPNPGRYIILWDLPMINDSDKYKSPHTQTRYIFNYLVERDFQTLAFTLSRKMAELNAFFSKQYFSEIINKRWIAEQIMSYRSGILPSDRRAIENALREMNLIGVYATNALELGVDIGTLDATILSGFPGTIASMWQQIGRAGRKYDENLEVGSISFIIPMEDPLHLYYIRHPDELFKKSHERCNLSLDNPYIIKGHLKCAAKEISLSANDKLFFEKKFHNTLDTLISEGIIKQMGRKYLYNSTDNFPAGSVDLNGIPENDFKVKITKKDGTIIEITESKNYVFKEMHPGAVYLYMTEPYHVDKIDLEEKVVYLSPHDSPTYTESLVSTDIQPIGKPDFSKSEGMLNVFYGSAKVIEIIHSYKIIEIGSGKVISTKELELPPLEFETKAVWFSMPEDNIIILQSNGFDFDGALHAIEHAAISMAPYFTMCDRWDLGGVSMREGNFNSVKWPTIYIYDGFPGGIGISERLYYELMPLLEKTYEMIKSCKCKEKCPGCVMSPKCGNKNEPLDKHGAIFLLERILSKNNP